MRVMTRQHSDGPRIRNNGSDGVGEDETIGPW